MERVRSAQLAAFQSLLKAYGTGATGVGVIEPIAKGATFGFNNWFLVILGIAMAGASVMIARPEGGRP